MSERPVQARPRRLADWINPTGAKKNHSLIDKVYKKENLSMAWERVKENGGSGGVDRQSIAGVRSAMRSAVRSVAGRTSWRLLSASAGSTSTDPEGGEAGRVSHARHTNGVRPRMSTSAAAKAGTDL